MRAGWLLVVLAACARDPIDDCPDLAGGQLVVTEVRGDADLTTGPWVELFNAGAGSVDLEGARIRFRRRDGSSEIPILVRSPLPVAAGDYVVLGRFPTGAPDFVDYNFADDFDGTWLAAAAIDVENCGELVDLAQYDVLPDVGTFSLGGAPDAEANDLPAAWCNDPTPNGTPGAANTACP